jgi:hypothetical protein
MGTEADAQTSFRKAYEEISKILVLEYTDYVRAHLINQAIEDGILPRMDTALAISINSLTKTLVNTESLNQEVYRITSSDVSITDGHCNKLRCLETIARTNAEIMKEIRNRLERWIDTIPDKRAFEKWISVQHWNRPIHTQEAPIQEAPIQEAPIQEPPKPEDSKTISWIAVIITSLLVVAIRYFFF